jgi:hypothetical protein
MGIVVGSVVDGVPESVNVLNPAGERAASKRQLPHRVMVSNVPEAIVPSADLAAADGANADSDGCGCSWYSRAVSRQERRRCPA